MYIRRLGREAVVGRCALRALDPQEPEPGGSSEGARKGGLASAGRAVQQDARGGHHLGQQGVRAAAAGAGGGG